MSVLWQATVSCNGSDCDETVTSVLALHNSSVIEAGSVRDVAQALGWRVRRKHRGQDLCPAHRTDTLLAVLAPGEVRS